MLPLWTLHVSSYLAVAVKSESSCGTEFTGQAKAFQILVKQPLAERDPGVLSTLSQPDSDLLSTLVCVTLRDSPLPGQSKTSRSVCIRQTLAEACSCSSA